VGGVDEPERDRRALHRWFGGRVLVVVVEEVSTRLYLFFAPIMVGLDFQDRSRRDGAKKE
jgi:hypothetical protein